MATSLAGQSQSGTCRPPTSPGIPGGQRQSANPARDIRVHALLGELLVLIDDKHIILELLSSLHHLLTGHLAGEGHQ
jgi:hypothetical protein